MLARSSNCWLCSYLLFVLASLFQHLKLLTLGSYCMLFLETCSSLNSEYGSFLCSTGALIAVSVMTSYTASHYRHTILSSHNGGQTKAILSATHMVIALLQTNARSW